MEANKEVEIPFGAKDSELKAWGYTIPEGMEAEIKDGKIIVREKERWDETIRKELIGFIQDEIDSINRLVSGDYDDRDADDIARQNWFKKAIAWLEKQGSQKLDNSAKTCKDEQNPIFRVGDYIRNTKTGDKVLIEQLEMATKAYFYVSYDGAAVNHSDFPFSQQDEWLLIGQKIIGQNLVWSEEDEKMLQGTINSLRKYQLSMPNFLVELQMRWLKSLKDRALWKPSDEQMEYLAKAMAMDEADKRKDILQNERELNSDTFTKEVSADNQALLDAAKEYKERTPFQFPNQLQPAYEAFIAGAQWQKQYWDK